MLLKIFTIYDSKTSSYEYIFTSKHKGEALRDFEQLANDEKTKVGKYPSDFTLFEIGEFNQKEGTLTAHKAKISLGTAIEFVKTSS